MTEQTLTATVEDRSPTMALITAVGEIDHDSRALLWEAATEALSRDRIHLVLDLTGVTFCDSGGLGLFIDVHRHTRARGGWLRLTGARPNVLNVVRVTNLDRLLAFYDDPRSAMLA